MADAKGWTNGGDAKGSKGEDDGAKPRREGKDTDDSKDVNKPNVQQGWGSPVGTTDSLKKEEPKAEAKKDTEADEDDKKDRRRARWDDEGATEILLIPDLEEEAEEDITTQVAAAPRNTAKRVQSLRELENDLKMTVSSSENGIDLSALTAHLVPAEMLEEEDVLWDFDSLLQEVTQEYNARAEKRPEVTAAAAAAAAAAGAAGATLQGPAAAAAAGGLTLLGGAPAAPGDPNALVRNRAARAAEEREAEARSLDDDVAARLDAMLNSRKAERLGASGASGTATPASSDGAKGGGGGGEGAAPPSGAGRSGGGGSGGGGGGAGGGGGGAEAKRPSRRRAAAQQQAAGGQGEK